MEGPRNGRGLMSPNNVCFPSILLNMHGLEKWWIRNNLAPSLQEFKWGTRLISMRLTGTQLPV